MKKYIILVFSILIIIYLIPVGMYAYYFGSNCLSGDINDWLLYSNFVNGLLNPVLSLINIIVLITLTIIVFNWDNLRTQKSLEKQSKIFKNTLKLDAFNAFRGIREKVMNVIVENKKDTSIVLYLLGLDLESLFSINKQLFNSINDKMIKEVNDSLDALSSVYEDYQKTGETYKKYTESLAKFLDVFDKLIKNISKDMVL
ncbi:MAG: hypothetical protein PF638_11275 [Candidatus Delongbacteria bacterium]|jgi:hypothetical protein|nr:hypothetical protein [Candidatus Delongbacteria bacterium]